MLERVYGHELEVGDVVYYRPETENCSILRVEKFGSQTIYMSPLNENATKRFLKDPIEGYFPFFIDYSVQLYKKLNQLQPTKQIKEFKLC